MCNNGNATLAHGATTVCSAMRGPECHGGSYYSSKDVAGAARGKLRDVILAFWESRGMAEYRTGGAGGGGRWYVRDNALGAAAWLPLAGQYDVGRVDVAEFSHVRAANNGGAWCACNLVGESGMVNANRADRDMSVSDIAPAWRATLEAWPAYWRANVARKASLARL